MKACGCISQASPTLPPHVQAEADPWSKFDAIIDALRAPYPPTCIQGVLMCSVAFMACAIERGREKRREREREITHA